MKSKFNKKWNSSKQPRKQVKFRAMAPTHIKRKLMASILDKPLRVKYGKRNLGIRRGDEVKIMRGKFKGKQGKVGKVDPKNNRLQVEGVQRAKKGGEKVETWFSPSKVKIMLLNTDDSKRMKKLKVVVNSPAEVQKTETKELMEKKKK
ncbi:MAG: 50S ribosomal protein L24 [archaeon]|nr:50S ribosomal protein L24 [archaeon]MCR4323952.1 50S ribosomal protein L24 [Nanoarchaeota archaeon]